VRAVVQRVREASVSVAGEVTASIGPGVLVLLGVASTDTTAGAERLAGKVARLRIFGNEAGRLDRSLSNIRAARRQPVHADRRQ
jgi:D-tyrosyl-tRNA(Tyr) deacylase